MFDIYKLSFVSAICIAAVAAFFSIYGLAHIYVSTFVAVVVMASFLEVGKLVAVSALYQLWDKLHFLLKSYLLIAVLGLMLITSAGIFGYLSNGYQQSSTDMKLNSQQIEHIDKQLNHISNQIEHQKEQRVIIINEFISNKQQDLVKIKDEINAQKERIRAADVDINNTPSTYQTAREKKIKLRDDEIRKLKDLEARYTAIDSQTNPPTEMMAMVDSDIKKLNDDFNNLTNQMQQIKAKRLEVEAHTGPIIYIAQAVGKSVDDAILWMTILIVLVFDPLAIALTLIANMKLKGQYTNDQVAIGVNQVDTVVNGPIAEEPTVKKTTIEEPVIEEPVIEEPVIEEPVIDESNALANDYLDEPTPAIDTEDKLNQYMDDNQMKILHPIEQHELDKLNKLMKSRNNLP